MSEERGGHARGRQGLCAVGVVCLAAALRFWGIRWGLPNELHSYSYHPDEFLLIGSALFVLTHSVVPHFYNYPSLYIYLAAVAVLVGAGYGVVSTPLDPSLPGVYLAARVVTALMGVGAVVSVYWAGTALFDRAAALVAAAVLAVTPLHVQHSHFATVDVPSTLFVALCLGFAGLMLRRNAWRDCLAAGAVAGLAAGTKYNAGLILLAPAAAHFAREGWNVRSAVSGKLWAMTGCAAAAFLISTPGAVVDYPAFAYGIGSELRHSAEGHGLVFVATGSGPAYALTVSLWHGLGHTMVGWFLAGVIVAVLRRSRPALVVLAFVVPYFVLVSVSQVRFARYTLPMFPAAVLLCGWFAVELWRALRQSRPSGLRWVWAVVFGASLALTLANTLALNRLFVVPDPRDRAARWIFAHVERGAGIGVPEVPWFYSPPYSPHIGFGTLPQRQEAFPAASYHIVVFADCDRRSDWARAEPPEWVVLSDYETDDALRVRGSPGVSGKAALQARRIADDVALVRELYRVEAVFANEMRLWGFRVGDTRELPHDMRYPSPTITVYRLRR